MVHYFELKKALNYFICLFSNCCLFKGDECCGKDI